MGLRKKTKAKADDAATTDVNQGEGLSLDAYFNSKKDYSVEAMKETSELLEKTKPADNAMVMTRLDDDDANADDADEKIPICAMHDDDDPPDEMYEDDYETETEPAASNAVAGLSLSDYLTGAPKKEKPKKPKKDDGANIEGMSLESYLGASSLDDDAKDAKKASVKRPKPPLEPAPKTKAAPSLQAGKKKPMLTSTTKRKDDLATMNKKNQGAMLMVKRKAPYKSALSGKKAIDDGSPTKQGPLPKLQNSFTCKAYGSAVDAVHDDDESRLPPLPH
ncbi:hypothetical protein SPRG_19531 [Saprolegnia parasitica CBS 223.65]|uniref:Uncharacterized protein n=1 Tax=Saprolegnia parasitica (strain CBS 223.65) TaxID=695850 RepID=A0A067CL69_SAPPC|nr:hypothetical protein SPRG_19531 [Saprolegnia parasitica CBS 223.65]KDO31238.1 hypothetical protein SPRG_19531 [Saprolegnia parasitica CBS 223.65]|eukprot:XP_012198097.1 hypothetical protein SPRG_19531 [Saprolegnia parasitica CBS 223.65]